MCVLSVAELINGKMSFNPGISKKSLRINSFKRDNKSVAPSFNFLKQSHNRDFKLKASWIIFKCSLKLNFKEHLKKKLSNIYKGIIH